MTRTDRYGRPLHHIRGMQVNGTRVDPLPAGFSERWIAADAHGIRVAMFGLFVCGCGFQAPGTRPGYERIQHTCRREA